MYHRRSLTQTQSRHRGRHRSGQRGQKKLIEQAYLFGESLGLPVWCTDQAGPFTTTPQQGGSWAEQGQPARQPHEYFRDGTAKILTLLHPIDGRVRLEGVTSTTNDVLHGWLKRELTAILAGLPEQREAESGDPAADRVKRRGCWERWQQGLTLKPTLLEELPPLRMLLVLDNLAGHKNADFVCWLFSQGVMPLYTPLGGSWLNMAESVQRILKRRALNGQHPNNPEQIMAWFVAVAEHWNRAPTPFRWAGKRKRRRERQRERRHRIGGSAAYTTKPIRCRIRTRYGHEQGK